MTDETLIPLDEAKRKLNAGAAPNSEYRAPILDVVDPCQLQGVRPPDRKWIIPEWIPHGGLTMLGGDGGLGKSLLAQQLMTACATGRPWLGLPTAPMKVLGVFCEDDGDELHRRQCAINKALGIDFSDLENMLWASRVGEESELVEYAVPDDRGYARATLEPTDLYRGVMSKAMDINAQLVVVDSLHDVFAGNENIRPEVRRFTRFLISLALEINGAVILTAHPSLSGLNSGSGTAGSTAWNNAVRSRIYLTHPKVEDGGEPDPDARVLSRKKANYARRDDSIRIRWADGVFVSQEPDIGFVGTLDRNTKARLAREVFLTLLDRREAEGRPVSHKIRAGNYAPKEFAKNPDREGFTRRDFDVAMETLFADKVIHGTKYGDRPSRLFDKIERAK